MKPFLLSAAIFYFSAAVVCNAQSSSTGSQSQSDSSKQSTQPSAASSSAPASPATDQDKEKTKKKPKKVWTNDELSTVSGGISVVGDSSASSSTSTSRKPIQSNSSGTEKEQRIAAYRDQIQQLRDQIDEADKKINDLRNFKADNTSPTGGLNMNKGYNMVPLEEQIKQLEDQKKKLQAKIEAVEDDARKNGIEAGQLR